MEKFLLGTVFSYNKLNIVNKKDIVVAVFCPEFRSGVIIVVIFVSDGINQLIGENFGSDIHHFFPGVLIQNKIPD